MLGTLPRLSFTRFTNISASWMDGGGTEMKYTVKEKFQETVEGQRVYEIEAESAQAAWDKVQEGTAGAPVSEVADVTDSRYEMVSAFVTGT